MRNAYREVQGIIEPQALKNPLSSLAADMAHFFIAGEICQVETFERGLAQCRLSINLTLNGQGTHSEFPLHWQHLNSQPQ